MTDHINYDAVPQVFPETGQAVRVVEHEGEPAWIAADLCAVLSIGNSRDALRSLDADEKGVVITDTPGGKQRLAVVLEPGLYSLMLRSRKPQAKNFKRWVLHEVLPALRKSGMYEMAEVPAGNFPVPQTFSEALMLAAEQAEQLELLKAKQEVAEKKIAELEPKAEAVDVYMRAPDGFLLIREVAKLLAMTENQLRDILVQQGLLFKRKNRFGEEFWDVRTECLTARLFVTKIYTKSKAGRALYTVYVTPKGVEHIRKVIAKLRTDYLESRRKKAIEA